MRRPPIPGLVLADGWLAPYEREIQARLRLYDSRVAQLTRRYGSPEECARGYTRMGFNRNEQGDASLFSGKSLPSEKIFLLKIDFLEVLNY